MDIGQIGQYLSTSKRNEREPYVLWKVLFRIMYIIKFAGRKR